MKLNFIRSFTESRGLQKVEDAILHVKPNEIGEVKISKLFEPKDSFIPKTRVLSSARVKIPEGCGSKAGRIELANKLNIEFRDFVNQCFEEKGYILDQDLIEISKKLAPDVKIKILLHDEAQLKYVYDENNNIEGYCLKFPLFPKNFSLSSKWSKGRDFGS